MQREENNLLQEEVENIQNSKQKEKSDKINPERVETHHNKIFELASKVEKKNLKVKDGVI